MAGQFQDETVQCPFYLAEMLKPPQTICCEGAEPGVTTHMRFISRDSKMSYKDRFCRISKWQNCPIAIGLTSKY